MVFNMTLENFCNLNAFTASLKNSWYKKAFCLKMLDYKAKIKVMRNTEFPLSLEATGKYMLLHTPDMAHAVSQ